MQYKIHQRSLIDQQNDQIECYQSILANLSKNQKPIIIMIDGIEETTPSSQYSSSISYYQTLLQLLPSNVCSPFFLFY